MQTKLKLASPWTLNAIENFQARWTKVLGEAALYDEYKLKEPLLLIYLHLLENLKQISDEL